MGIKSTRTLTRAQALELREEFRAKLAMRSPTNHELGNELDKLHEQVCERDGTTCFDNYLVEG